MGKADENAWQALNARHMTPKQLLATTRALGLNRAAAGRYIGTSERTARRMFKGKAEIPVSAVLLLRLMVKHGEEPLVPPWDRAQN